MKKNQSAGILAYRYRNSAIEFFLVHPGGPFWKNKDHGSWSIPKGEFSDEEPLDAARREFFEETGFPPQGDFLPLKPVRQKSGKLIFGFASKMEIDANAIRSNEFEIEWPHTPENGRCSLRWIKLPGSLKWTRN